MKKTTILALTLALALAGCAKSETAETTAATTAAETTAAVETTTAAETTEAETEAAGQVMTYDEYMAAELDSQVVIETYVQAKQSWWENKATLYTQDQDGAYFIYDMACSEEDYEKLVPGTKIRVTGYKAEWSGEIEIMDGTFEFVEGGDTFIAEALDVTELLGTDKLINHQNQFVSFKGMTVAPLGPGNEDAAFLYNWDGSGADGDDLYFNVSYNGQTYTFLVESYLCDNTTDVYNAVKELKVGDVIDMEGYLYWYEGVNPHIISITEAAEASAEDTTEAAETSAAN